MDIQPTSLTTLSSPSGSGPQLNGTRDEFLKLFLAQLQHQDPLDPKSGADMVAQLAQFSAVEQQVATNQHLAELAATSAGASAAGLSDLVDRTCTAAAGTFAIDAAGGTPPPLTVTSPDALKDAEIVVRDANGNEVRRIAVPPTGGKTATVAWDGLDANGVKAPPGSYSIEAVSASGQSVSAAWTGRIETIELTPDGPRLRMGGVLILPADVRTIGSTTNPGDPQ